MKLRITGIATVLALAVCLALLTTGAFAQSMQKHAVLGGGPLPMAPAVVAPRVAPRVAPATHATSPFGIGVATSHALSGGGFGDNCGSQCGNGLTGTSASGTAIGLGLGSGTGLGLASSTLGQHGGVAPVASGSHGVQSGCGNWLNSLGDLGSLGIFH